MQIHEWLCVLTQYLYLFPLVLSCYLPMKNQLRYSKTKTALICLAVLVPFVLVAAWVQMILEVHANWLQIPAAVLFFPLYCKTLKADLPRCLAVYTGVCAAQTFPAQFANTFNAWAYSTGDLVNRFTPEAGLFHGLLACLLPLAVMYPVCRQCAWMIDHLVSPRIWYSTVILSSVFLVINIAAISRFEDFKFMRHDLFPLLEACAMALLAAIYVLFYQGSRILLEHAQLEQRSQLLEMQSHQYRVLQEHMRQTAQLRHDFRHSVRLLSTLAEQENLESIRTHLAKYEHVLEKAVSVHYCSNATLNALFGYYHEMAVSTHIETNWKIELPEPLAISELDLASLFGNLIENAIEGSQTLPEDKRYFSLTTEVQHGNCLYIVSTNSFDGCVKKWKSGYRSTKHGGSGIGLASISAVVEKYHGSVQFSNSDREFFVDIVLCIDQQFKYPIEK